MIQWTSAASDYFARTFERLRPELVASGADPDEVMDDTRRHIEEELTAQCTRIVTEEEVRRLIARMNLGGGPVSEAAAGSAACASPSSAEPADADDIEMYWRGMLDTVKRETARTRLGWRAIFILMFGVLLPVAAAVVELSSRMCTEAFFDPLPTPLHAALFLLAPAAHLWVLISSWSSSEPDGRLLRLAVGLALGVNIAYTAIFLPILPVSVIAILFMGVGLLGLAPLLSLISSAMCWKAVKYLPVRSARPWAWSAAGLLAAFLALAAYEANKGVTYIGYQMASSTDAVTQSRGVRMLRAVGDDDMLLRACYDQDLFGDDLLGLVMGWSVSSSTDQARTIYYRVTGEPFNKRPAPNLRGLSWRVDGEFDEDLGGDSVGRRIHGLALEASTIDGSIDPDAALSYTEWTLVFGNSTRVDQEARAQILLPPGGVVTRVTLWINGKECEAAFGTRSQVREAYESVVRQRRDPLLVTTQGPDRILAQCYPVPPGGTMKVRLGVTAPLHLVGLTKARLAAPVFLAVNFDVPGDLAHSVWFESEAKLTPVDDRLAAEHPRDDLYAVRGEVRHDAMDAGPVTVQVERPAAMQSWTPDIVEPERYVIRQQIARLEVSPVDRIVVVIDESASMAGLEEALRRGLMGAPEGVEPIVLAARDEVETLRMNAGRSGGFDGFAFDGGQDNVPALARAWDLAAEAERGAVLWICGPQPVAMQSVESLRQRWRRRPDGPGLTVVQVRHGVNKVLEGLEDVPSVRLARTIGDAARDVVEALDSLTDRGESWTFVRQRVSSDLASAAPPADWGERTSDHLARLWAYSEVWARALDGDEKRKQTIATNYRLVTPWTGAVVLESKQQYDTAGLDPALGAENVPTVPEPEEWALIIVVAALAAWALVGRRRVRWA